jgi:hypothetical protein
MPGAIRGRVGVIKWHTYTAATVEGYTLTRDDKGATTLTATVIHQDRFKVTQRPLIFEAIHKAGAWRWPIVSFTIGDSGRLVARLGPEIPGDLCPDSLNPKSSVLT